MLLVVSRKAEAPRAPKRISRYRLEPVKSRIRDVAALLLVF